MSFLIRAILAGDPTQLRTPNATYLLLLSSVFLSCTLYSVLFPVTFYSVQQQSGGNLSEISLFIRSFVPFYPHRYQLLRPQRGVFNVVWAVRRRL